jgi:integrase/recombinase XerD
MRPTSKIIQRYLELRRGLGFKLQTDERHLRKFLGYLVEKKATRITPQLALEFATEPKGLAPSSQRVAYNAVRSFASYWRGFDPTTETPPAGLIRCPNRRARPRICSEAEIERLLATARDVPPLRVHGLKPWTLYTMFGLLTVTGMRISEALHLQLGDIDWKECVLIVRDTKFGKTRLIPLHPSTLKALVCYARRRHRHLASRSQPPSSYFFVTNNGTPLSDGNARGCFRELLHKAGMLAPGQPNLRIHDLRHRFAVETLRRWYRHQGEHVDRRLPELSTYLGHVNVASTYWYLSCTPELRAVASKRVEARWKGVGI